MTSKSAVIVLANLMDKNANLNEETRDRVELGCRTANEQNAEIILFIGWNYREDCNTPIAIAMRDYALEHKLVSSEKCFVNTLSRDTVGDAVLSRAHFAPLVKDFQITVVTSDYHAKRTQYLFETVWGKDAIALVLGATTPKPDRHDSEARSIAAFDETFKDVDFSDANLVQQRLLSSHPFYNGEMKPSRPFPIDRLEALANQPFADC